MKLRLFLILCFSFSTLFSNENASFSEMQEAVKKAVYWAYPYPQLIPSLQEQGEKSILIFSYGSLMDPSSAAETLSAKSNAARRPAIAFGVRRLFDRDIPVIPGSKWGNPKNPKARGMLNILLSDKPEDFINGVLIEVDVADIPHVLFREKQYDLLPVIVQNWDHACGAKPQYFIAHTFYTPQNRGNTSSDILPRPVYFELTQNASLQYGQLFYRIWLKTTYLADGITPISTWEQNQKP